MIHIVFFCSITFESKKFTVYVPKYPDLVPVICERSKTVIHILTIPDLSISFLYIFIKWMGEVFPLNRLDKRRNNTSMFSSFLIEGGMLR